MPQMMPMNWEILFLTTTFLLMLLAIFLFFSITANKLSTEKIVLTNSSSPQLMW